MDSWAKDTSNDPLELLKTTQAIWLKFFEVNPMFSEVDLLPH